MEFDRGCDVIISAKSATVAPQLQPLIVPAVAAWALDPDAGPDALHVNAARDRSGNARHLTSFAATVDLYPDARVGKRCIAGPVVNGDAGSTYLADSTLAFDGVPFSLLGRAFLTHRNQGYYRVIATYTSNAGFDQEWTLYVDNAARQLSYQHKGSPWQVFRHAGGVPSGWFFFALRRNAPGTVVRLTINTDTRTSGTLVAPLALVGGMRLDLAGHSSVADSGWKGGLADLALYSEELTDDQLSSQRAIMLGSA